MERKKKEKCLFCERRKKLIKAKICDKCSCDISDDGNGKEMCDKCPINNPCPFCEEKGFRDWIDEMRRPYTRVIIEI